MPKEIEHKMIDKMEDGLQKWIAEYLASGDHRCSKCNSQEIGCWIDPNSTLLEWNCNDCNYRWTMNMKGEVVPTTPLEDIKI